MDELTIAGKRYISARRAAREHRYHSDYIGQLVRAGKVTGQKVGRSWYVEEESLLNYFNGEGAPAGTAVLEPRPQVEKKVEEKDSTPATVEVIEKEKEPMVVPVAEEAINTIQETIVEEKIKESMEAPLMSDEEPVHVIPLHVVEKSQEEFPNTIPGGLTYLSEEPAEETGDKDELTVTATPVVEQSAPRRSSKRYSWVPVTALFIFGLCIFGASLVLGGHLNATVGVVEGQGAASGFVFEW